MANYTKATDFQAKDALLTGNPAKIIKGTELNDEFNNIQTAITTKADLASPAFTGNPTATTQVTGNNSSRVATTAFVQQEITANESSVAITGGTIDGVAITGGTITGLATDLAVADGGTGASSFTLNSVVLGNNIGALNGNMVAPGTAENVLKSNGTTWVSGTITTITATTGTAPYYGCRAWANFNGVGGTVINASGNIASISRTAAGTYTVTFTTAMPDTGYSVVGMTGGDNAIFRNQHVALNTSVPKTTTSFGIVCQNAATAGIGDTADISIMVMR